MTKIVFFVFQSDPVRMQHVLQNVLDLEEKGLWGEIVFEGDAVNLIPEMADPDHFLHQLYSQAKIKGLLWGACLSCAQDQKITQLLEAENIPLNGDMSGHPPMSLFVKQDYHIVII